MRSADIIDALPGLRRYAEALLGARDLADALVELGLERLLAEQQDLRPESLKPALFAVFNRVHDEVFGRPDALGAAVRAAAQRHRSAIAARKAVLLVALARFSIDETATLLGMPREAVARQIAAVRDRARRASGLTVLLIEDEAMAALGIAQTLRHMGHDVAVAATRVQALECDQRRRPGLIIADLQLRDGDTGLPTVKEIWRRRPVPVIFATGSPQRLVAERELAHSFVLAKPFDARALESAVRQATAPAS